MIKRTPFIGTLPKVLRRTNRANRTPVIDGFPAKPLEAILEESTWGNGDLETAVKVATAMPGMDPTYKRIYEEMINNSCAFFASEVLQGPPEPPYNGKFIIGKHHLAWDEQVNNHTRLLIMASRDIGKSFFFSFAYPIWRAGFNSPGSEGYIFSASQAQAEEFLGKIQEEVLSNPKLKFMIPPTGDRFWSAGKMVLANGSKIVAKGFGTKVRGRHPDWVICDDVLNDDDIYSETVRRKNIDYFLSAITGMVHRQKQLIVVGTPFHSLDLYGELQKAGSYSVSKFPIYDLKTKIPTFPERYNAKDIEAKRKELNSEARFAREFLTEPLSDEASLFPRHLFEDPEILLPYTMGMPASYWDERGMARYTGVDIALSAETKADYFVVFTIAVDDFGNRWIVNIRRGRGYGFQKQINIIKEEYAAYRPEVIHIEANQAQRVWTDEVARTTDIPVRRFFTTGVGGVQPKNSWRKGATAVSANKNHIEKGVPGLRISLENRKWRIPRGNAYSIDMSDAWIGEMACMGWLDGKVQSVGEHDDLVLSCWMADTAARMGGARLDWMDGKTFDSKLPIPPELKKDLKKTQDMREVYIDQLEQERYAIDCVQSGQPIQQMSPEAYFSRVRTAIKSYAENKLDSGDYEGARFAVEEYHRLDRLYNFKAYEISREYPNLGVIQGGKQ